MPTQVYNQGGASRPTRANWCGLIKECVCEQAVIVDQKIKAMGVWDVCF